MKKILTVALTLLLVGCASVPSGENVSYSIQTEENVQNTQQTADPGQNSTESGTDLPDTQDSAENDDLGEPNQVEEDLRERAEAGKPEVVDAPNVAEYALSSEIVDDGICKLREVSGAVGSSFPRSSTIKVPIIGTVKMQVVYLQWGDLPGTGGDYDYHVQELNKARDFYRVMSEGKFNLDITYADTWATVDGSYKDFYTSDYMADARPDTAEHLQFVVDAFIDATDDTVDYSDMDVIFFAFPRAEMIVQGGGMHIFDIADYVLARTDEGIVRNMFSLGSAAYDHAYSDLGWATFVHEFGHTLRIPDLRDWSDGKDQLRGDDFQMYLVNPMYGFDIMDNQAAGTRSISGWIKWIQGWLNDSQVTCVDAATVNSEYYRLDEANLMNADNELLVVRLSDTKALAIESRRWDSRFDLPVQNSRDGVIVYVVDATRGHAEGPLKLLSPRDITRYLSQDGVWPDWRMLDVVLFEGDSVTYDGVTVTVENSRSNEDIVRVSR